MESTIRDYDIYSVDRELFEDINDEIARLNKIDSSILKFNTYQQIDDKFLFHVFKDGFAQLSIAKEPKELTYEEYDKMIKKYEKGI
ncbi:hypothetical protein [Sphingobacterium sp. 18053]|uniref:hypothetical protein n=1 Tax=Sphingobacterium sp. 18053 TaxID=2681401 RepID=UPI00135BB369|nr:hypothetical protein [Sphingobacterium sp. 18053]